MKKFIILLFLTSCGNFLTDNDPSAALNKKLSEMHSPVVVVSKGAAFGEDSECFILVKDSVGTVRVLYNRSFATLKKGDTIK